MPAPTFVLVHSPLVGPTTWAATARTLQERGRAVAVPSLIGLVEAPQPQHRFAVDAVRAAVADAGGPVVLAGHSGAGLLLPAIADGLDVAALLFVDASLPPIDATSVPLAPQSFLDQLARRSDERVLSPWHEWFPRRAIKALVPDRDQRRTIVDEMPRLPVTYFGAEAEVPAGWTALPAAYLRLTKTYDPRAEEATERGWPVGKLDGVGHLAMATHGDAVADALLDLEARALSPAAPRG